MPRYQLTRPFFDGRVVHPARSIVILPEAMAPKSAVNLDEPDAQELDEPFLPFEKSLETFTEITAKIAATEPLQHELEQKKAKK